MGGWGSGVDVAGGTAGGDLGPGGEPGLAEIVLGGAWGNQGESEPAGLSGNAGKR